MVKIIIGHLEKILLMWRWNCYVFLSKRGFQCSSTCNYVIPAKAGIQRQSLKEFYVYILCSKRNGILYTGVTSDLVNRVYEHKNDLVDGFTRKYNVHRLVWYEIHESWESAIQREKQIKKWKREWKLKLIEQNNPSWDDLYENICRWGLWIPASAGMTSPFTMSINRFPHVHKWFLRNILLCMEHGDITRSIK